MMLWSVTNFRKGLVQRSEREAISRHQTMSHFNAIKSIFLLFHKSCPEKKANHAITPPARGASDMKSVSFLQMIYMLCSKISYLPTTFSTAHDFKFSNDAFLFAAMILLWCFFVTSSKMDVLYWSRTPSHFFPVNFQNNSNLQLWNCFNIFHHWYM